MELAWPNKFFAKWQSRLKSSAARRSQRTYILPTGFGLLFGLMSLVLLYSSFASGNNLMYLYTFLTISIAFSSLWLTHVNIVDLTIDAVEVEDIYADTKAYAKITLLNRSRRSLYAIQTKVAKRPTSLTGFIQGSGYSWTRVDLGEFPRGVHSLPRITIDSEYPFFLVRSWKNIEMPNHFIVYPKPEGHLPLPHSHRAQDQENQGQTFEILRSPESEFSGHRRYEPSDSYRQIDWKAYARTEKILVKEFQGYQPQTVHIAWEKTSVLKDYEKRLSQMALWVEIAESKGFLYSFQFEGTQIPPDRGRNHFLSCLKILAQAPASPGSL